MIFQWFPYYWQLHITQMIRDGNILTDESLFGVQFRIILLLICDLPRYSHPGGRVSNSSPYHCTACGTVSPSLSYCISLGFQWRWSASDYQSLPEATDNGHCLMGTNPQHLKRAQARGKKGMCKLNAKFKMDYFAYFN